MLPHFQVETSIQVDIGALIVGVDPESVKKLGTFFLNELMPKVPALPACDRIPLVVQPEQAPRPVSLSVSSTPKDTPKEIKALEMVTPQEEKKVEGPKKERTSAAKMKLRATFGCARCDYYSE